jgi:C1A family cysteine protease
MNTIPCKWRYHGGWTPDLPNPKHKKYLAIADQGLLANPKTNADLTGLFLNVVNQDGLNCCTACASTGAFEYELGLAKGQRVSSFFSFIFLYYNQRVLQNTLHHDSGASISDALYALSHRGVCIEAEWADMFREFTKKPYKTCYEDALNNRIGAYYQLDRDLTQMKACLSEGHPFIFGFSAYDSAQVAPNGNIPMPGDDDTFIFGHAMVAVGYDDEKQLFSIRNSWGNSWGDSGYGTIPYEYLKRDDLSRDFWTIRLDSPALLA